jgi:hypothetical protein
MIERTSISGFMVGRRYRGIGNAPMFFISYETTEAAVFNSRPYLDRLNNPTSWTKEALTHFDSTMRNIYRLVAASGAQAPSEAPYCLAVRFNIRPEAEAEMINWYNKDCLPALKAIDGVFRARLFEVDQAISNIQTAERAIYGGGPGQQKYLVYCEMMSPEVAESPEFMAVRRGDGDPEMFKNLENIFEDLSWLEFAMYNPDYMKG